MKTARRVSSLKGRKETEQSPEVPVSEVNLAGAAAKTGCFAWSAGSCVVAPCLKGVLPARLAHSFVGVPETECIFNLEALNLGVISVIFREIRRMPLFL